MFLKREVRHGAKATVALLLEASARFQWTSDLYTRPLRPSFKGLGFRVWGLVF